MATKEIDLNLEAIVTAKKQYLTTRQARIPRAAVIALAEMQTPPKPVLNIVTRGRHITLIGQIRQHETYDPVAAALRYARRGVDAVSMFTDSRVYTKGMDDLLLVSRGVRNTAVIAQDYVLDEYHVTEARAAGASSLVLYASVLEPDVLRRVTSLTQRWQMSTVIQVENEPQLKHAIKLSPHVLAVGLDHTFDRERDLPLLKRLKPLVPYHTKFMALGCIKTLYDVAQLIELGVDALIVDENLTERKDDYQQLRLMLEFHSEW
ncbi:MAG: hypothetical protein OHK0046_09030 [Anaerolineae bacterium]